MKRVKSKGETMLNKCFSQQSENTKYISNLLHPENGHNPIWNETCEFLVKNPHFAMLRFEVQDEDMFGEPNFIAQAVYPVSKYGLICHGYCQGKMLIRFLLFIDITAELPTDRST